MKEFTVETLKECKISGCRCKQGDDLIQIPVPIGGLLIASEPTQASAPRIEAKPFEEPIQNLIARVNKRCPRQVTRLESPVGKCL